MRPLHCVPEDPALPYEVDSVRVYKELVSLGHDPQALAGKCSYEVRVGDDLFYICQTKTRSHLSVRTTWQTQMPYDKALGQLFAACDTWNRQRTFPTVYLQKGTDGSSVVVADFLVDCRQGLSDLQLSENLRVGFDSGRDAMVFMKEAARKFEPRLREVREEPQVNEH